MTRFLLITGVLGTLACGSTAPKATQSDNGLATTDPRPLSSTQTDTSENSDAPKPGSDAAKAKADAAKVVVSPSPIKLPNGIMYDGYIIGGLPSKADIDSALEENIETAMSLMANDEEGISEIGPYAASKGFRYIRFTIAGKDDLNESMAWQFASTLPLLEKPGIVHSARGSRVGAIFALMAFFVDERSAEDALAIGKAIGLGDLEDHVRSLLQLPAK